ncbi:MAG: hypothetical protein GY841_01820 [FCB group bacterium]|nr:hypothetical protein [FCB group bacterium]
MDDVIAVSPDENETKWVFNELKSMEIKYLGEVDKFLGIRVTRNKNVYTMDQKLMKIDLLKKLQMEKSKPVGTPITDEYNHSNESQNVILGNVNCSMDEINEKGGTPSTTMYKSLVGSLLWISRCTIPDISFAVQVLTRACAKPTLWDWKMGKRILRYLNGSLNKKMYI